jgi:hypothetical protein
MKPFQRLCPECEFKKAVETAKESHFLSTRLKPGVTEKSQFRQIGWQHVLPIVPVVSAPPPVIQPMLDTLGVQNSE